MDKERNLYINKEKEKLQYAVTEAGGLIAFSMCMALLAALYAGRKMFQPLSEETTE